LEKKPNERKKKIIIVYSVLWGKNLINIAICLKLLFFFLLCLLFTTKARKKAIELAEKPTR
jgi:hypothetical protein